MIVFVDAAGISGEVVGIRPLPSVASALQGYGTIRTEPLM